jgi:indolepyruvate ferredoxin oxidoreductase alpha subunit
MAKFKEIIDSPEGSRLVLQGNEAFALGVVHAGYHAADGYPGTPSTEVIDKSLARVQDRLRVGWSVNEAVAVGVAAGHAVAGSDTVVTMKIPGVFQAGDAITTSAFYTADAGALVIYAASDYAPSSTQHVIDPRYFFASSRLPVFEPRDHQEMYDAAFHAREVSREFRTPVVVLASGVLCHSEGTVRTRPPRREEPRALPEDLRGWMLMPAIARRNYDEATAKRIPALRAWLEENPFLTTEVEGEGSDWGLIASGESAIIVREALTAAGLRPPLLTLGMTNPLPLKRIAAFAGKIRGPLLVIEDGYRFVQERLFLAGIRAEGKDEDSTLTDWTPEAVLSFLSRRLGRELAPPARRRPGSAAPPARPPSICPGCPFRAFALAVEKLRRQKKVYAVFGDIGCSTLLYFLKALDTVMCMGASDSMRQGFVLSRPEMARRTLSVIGDSCECHSGLDSTRNAVFRNVPGVKVVLDNRTTAMTGGQPAPSSPVNLAGLPNRFHLDGAIEAEQCRTVVLDAYRVQAVEKALAEALSLAEGGEFSVLVLKGPCLQSAEPSWKARRLEVDAEGCTRCGLCAVCPGIRFRKDQVPEFTNLCTNCGGRPAVCEQRCPRQAIRPVEKEPARGRRASPPAAAAASAAPVEIAEAPLPASLRLAIRGIGGQGNLFFGKVLSEVASRTRYRDARIVKGDTHGMAQLGGPVISTFACGEAFSPILAPGSADVLVAMEGGEVLRPGFLDLLKPGGTVILNRFTAVPAGAAPESYPSWESIEGELEGLRVVSIDANQAAYDLGDRHGRLANCVALGLLSSLAPFDAIAEGVWLQALQAVSPDPSAAALNLSAFRKGRLHAQPRTA